ncbi:MAG: zinc ribbon domain-containing protein [Phycisphaerales bacterium]|nr:zinc ribbon domain-containing protein [Phycisphaerales bacterium]
MKSVFLAKTSAEAALVAELLEQHGIRAVAVETTLDLGSTRTPFAKRLPGVRVCVASESADAAAEVIAQEYRRRPEVCPACSCDLVSNRVHCPECCTSVGEPDGGLPWNCPECDLDLRSVQVQCPECGAKLGEPVGPPWDCPACGEDNEDQFSICWNCGLEVRDDAGDEPGEGDPKR